MEYCLFPIYCPYSPAKLLKSVVQADSESKKEMVKKTAYGYGGKYGVETDRMDKVTLHHSTLLIHIVTQVFANKFAYVSIDADLWGLYLC